MIETRLIGKFSRADRVTGQLAEANLHVHNGKPVGQVVYSTDYDIYESTVIPLLDENGSIEMAVDGTFGGTPELIHNGTDSAEWTASAISGTWDFASTAQAQAGTKSVDATATVNDDEALFEDGTTTDFSNYVGLSGYVYLTKYSAARNEIQARFRFEGGDIGNSVNIADAIDSGLLNVWQKFSFSKSAFGIDTDTVDEFVIRTVSTSGSPPDYYLDTMQIEETGLQLFVAAPPTFNKFLATRINFQITDALPGTVADGTMPGLSYNKILNMNQLTSGIILTRFRRGKVAFSAALRDLSDFLLVGATIDSLISDGTNTSIVLQAFFDAPVVLDKKHNDFVSISFSEDLSELISVRSVLLGKTEDRED